MGYVVLYMGMMVFGYFVASKLRHLKEKMGFVNGIMLFCVSLMVFIMGIKMGSNEEVIQNLGTIGIQSVVITVILVLASIISVTMTRKILGINKWGLTKSQQEEIERLEDIVSEEENAETPESSNLMTILIIVFVILGLAVGYFIVRTQIQDMDRFDRISSNVMTAGLCLLMFSVGFDMGLEGKVLTYLKGAGLRVLVFPLAVILGTTAGGLLISVIFSDLSVAESLAISYGFGWYTFAPISIANAGYVMASAISFLHNVIRELGGIVLIPILAKRIGYIEVTTLPGVAAMDVCLPIIEKVTRQDIIVYSMVIGFFEGVLVPVLVNMAIGL